MATPGRAEQLPLVIGPSCTACGACLLTCPEHALRPAPGRPVVTEGCTRCGECVEICPADAITIIEAGTSTPGIDTGTV